MRYIYGPQAPIAPKSSIGATRVSLACAVQRLSVWSKGVGKEIERGPAQIRWPQIGCQKSQPFEQLTARQRGIFQLLAEGQTNKAIGLVLKAIARS